MRPNYLNQTGPCGSLRSILLPVLIWLIPFAFTQGQTFTHPGILHKQSDFDRMRTQVNAGAQPWKGSYDKLVASPEAQLSWTPRATATIIRGGTGDNVGLLYRDVHAAYQHALIYKITGNTAHGNKARDILNAWSATHTTLSGNADRYLASGLFGYQFANAAEMMRGYSGFDVARFRTYLLNVFYYPLVERFLIGNSNGADHNDACISNYWANWDICNMNAMIAIGVFCDNRDIYNKGIEYFKGNLEYFRNHPVYSKGRLGNGTIRNAVPFIHSQYHGQWQESGRDQPHSILGVGLMAAFCEIAWNQGDNMYGYDDNRFRKGAEYVAKYNRGQSVPYTPYSRTGPGCNYNEGSVISTNGRGEVRLIWEMIYNHYNNRVGQGADIGYIAEWAAAVRPEGGPAGHATTYDHPSFGSLTYYGGSATGGGSATYYKIQNRGTGLVLDGLGRTANGSVLGQYANNTTHVNAQWERIATGTYYQFRNRGTGLFIDGEGRKVNGADVAQYANTTSVNSHWTLVAVSGTTYYKIQNRATGYVLDGMGRTANESACGQYANNTTSVNAQWQLVAVSSSARMAVEEQTISDEEPILESVYPNPATNEITITLPASYKEGEKTVSMLDGSGKTAIFEKFSGVTHTIYVGTIPQGLYILKVRSNKKLIVKKVIKK